MSTLSLIGILIIAIVLIYLSIKIIKSSNSEEKFTGMQTYWFVFIFFIRDNFPVIVQIITKAISICQTVIIVIFFAIESKQI